MRKIQNLTYCSCMSRLSQIFWNLTINIKPRTTKYFLYIKQLPHNAIPSLVLCLNETFNCYFHLQICSDKVLTYKTRSYKHTKRSYKQGFNNGEKDFDREGFR